MNIMQEIQTLSGAIRASLDGSNYHMSRDEVNKVGAIYKHITNGRRINLACADCVKSSLQFIQVWYERNQPTNIVKKQKNK